MGQTSGYTDPETLLSVIVEMAEACTKSNQTPRPEQKQKLNELFDNIHTKDSIDFTNQEVRDIQSAVHRMLERVVARVDVCGIFSITHIELR